MAGSTMKYLPGRQYDEVSFCTSSTEVPAAGQTVEGQTNPELVLEWVRQAELHTQLLVDERRMIFERLQLMETAQAKRFADQQNTIAHLFEEHFARIKDLYTKAETNVVDAAVDTAGGGPYTKSETDALDAIDAAQPKQKKEHLSQSGQQRSAAERETPQNPKPKNVRQKTFAEESRDVEPFQLQPKFSRISAQTTARGPLEVIFSKKTYQKLGQAPDNPVARFAQSQAFNLIMAIPIVLNAVYIGVTTNMAMSGILGTEHDHDHILAPIEDAFVFWFAGEVLMRLIALRMSFFFGDDWNWNLFDFVIVLSSSGYLYDDVFFLRVLRVVRMARIFGSIQRLRVFQELRLFVRSVFASLMTFFWASVVVLLVHCLFSLVFMQALISTVESMEAADAAEFVEEGQIRRYFGTLRTTMQHLFMACTGGIEWRLLWAPLDKAHQVVSLLLSAYVTFLMFGVASMLMGVIVQRTLVAFRSDLHFVIDDEVQKNRCIISNVEQLFIELGCKDLDNLTAEDFATYIENDNLQVYLKSHGLSQADAYDTFDKLERVADVEGKGVVTVADFACGCLQATRAAKDVYVQALLKHSESIRKFSESTCAGIWSNHEVLARLEKELAVVRHGVVKVRDHQMHPLDRD